MSNDLNLQKNTRYILAGRLIDGTGCEVQRKVYLAVDNSRITEIGPLKELPCNNRDSIIDLSRFTLLPALVDCSVTLMRSSSVDEKIRMGLESATDVQKEEMLTQHLQYCASYGVLGVAANDPLTSIIHHFQKVSHQGCSVDVRMSPDLTNSENINTDSDYIKVHYTGNIDDKQPSALSYDELLTIIRNRGDKKVVVVANGQQQVKEVLEAGCDALEQGYEMGVDNLRTMEKKNILWIPAILRAKNSVDGSSGGGNVSCRFSQRYVAPGKPIPGAEAYWKKMLTDHMELLSEARKMHVATAIGTGAGAVGLLHGESVLEEMKLFMKAGYSLEEAIRCGSENSADFFGMGNIGKLTPGQKATFLFTRGTVKQLPRKLSYLEGIYINGSPSKTYSKTPQVSHVKT